MVSICIPCHNAAPYLGAALDSVLAQSWQDMEIIVVNDGSTDGCGEILEAYKSRGVKVIHEPCGSAAKARNRALREANGDYIKFFDADDLMNPSMIERQMARLSGRTDAVASSEWGRFYDDDPGTFRTNPEKVWRDMEATDWLVESWFDARPMMQPGIFLIPRAVIEQVGGWDENLTLIDDFEFFARVLCHTKEVRFTPGAILFYRSGLAASLSGRKSRSAAESAFSSAMKAISHLLQRRSDEQARLSCANIIQSLLYLYYPEHSDLCAPLEQRIVELGGSNLAPDGSPRFQQLRRLVGWRLARRAEKIWARLR